MSEAYEKSEDLPLALIVNAKSAWIRRSANEHAGGDQDLYRGISIGTVYLVATALQLRSSVYSLCSSHEFASRTNATSMLLKFHSCWRSRGQRPAMCLESIQSTAVNYTQHMSFPADRFAEIDCMG
jgi:hypothetical protein